MGYTKTVKTQEKRNEENYVTQVGCCKFYEKIEDSAVIREMTHSQKVVRQTF